MSLMLGKLYDALRAGTGITDVQAREAAEEVASYERAIAGLRIEIRVVQTLLGVVIVLSFGVLWLVLDIHQTLAAVAAKVGVP